MSARKKNIDAQTLEILSSIKQIIADDGGDGDKPVKKSKAAKPAIKAAKPLKKIPTKSAAKKPPKRKTHPKKRGLRKPQEDILVLTEIAPEEPPKPKDAPARQQPPVQQEGHKKTHGLVEKLEMDDALEALVRSMLKEKLDAYLDQHLSDIVNKVAAEELAKKRDDG